MSLSYLRTLSGKLKALKISIWQPVRASARCKMMNGREALEGLCLGGMLGLALSPDALDGLGAEVLLVSNCDKIGSSLSTD